MTDHHLTILLNFYSLLCSGRIFNTQLWDQETVFLLAVDFSESIESAMNEIRIDILDVFDQMDEISSFVMERIF